MSYLSTEMSDKAYAAPLQRSLGTYFNMLASDREFYKAICESLVGAFHEPWRVLGCLQKLADPSTLYVDYRGELRLWKIPRSSTRADSDLKTCFELPEGIVGARLLQDTTIDPNVVLVDGIDYQAVQWGKTWWLKFYRDPFSSGDFEVTSQLNTSNEIDDQFITVWLVFPAEDSRPLENNWGAIWKTEVPDENQRAAVLSLLGSSSTGPSSMHLMLGASRSCGHPACEIDKETVELVGEDHRGRYVITDQSVYRYPVEASIIVVAGDILSLGQPISSAVRWYDLSRSAVPPVPAWAVSKQQLGVGYTGELAFINQEVDVIVTSQADKTKVETALGGNEADRQLFWADVHSRGVAGGRTLANYLDRRPNPVGEPQARDLPATLNPFVLLLEESLIYHAVMGIIDFSQAINPRGSQFIAAWRRLLPSHQELLVYGSFSVSRGSYPGPTGSNPQFGLVMMITGGYYGLGSYGSAGGNPTVY